MILQTFKLGKRYGRRWVVRDLDLQVESGDIFGFLGPNGAGKSTTIRMLLGLVRPSRGHVELLSKNVQRQREAALSAVGAVVEAPAFYDHLTGWKNLELFAAMSGGASVAQMSEVIEFVGLTGREHDPVRVYSHGMRQRLGIAQSLLPQPRIVILDEPTDGLDPAGVHEIRNLILRLREQLGLTVFLSTHMLNEVEQLCNRVAIINHGQLLYQGPVQALLSQEIPEWRIAVDNGARAQEVLQRAGFAASLDGAPDTLAVRVEARRIPAITSALVNEKLNVYRIEEKRKTLEQAFLALTNPEPTNQRTNQPTHHDSHRTV